MSDQVTHADASDFQLFERNSFLGLEKVAQWSWCRQPTARSAFLFAVLLAWVPLALLAAFQGVAWGPTSAQPLLLDVGVYARIFVALPLLILAPTACSSRLRVIVKHFLEANLVKESEQARFSQNFARVQGRRDSRWVDWTLLALAYAYMAFVAVQVVPGLPASWRTIGPQGQRSLTAAGWWFVLVSWPLYLFALFRFFYRLSLWWRFLWDASRLDLQLNATLPDRAGGLAFLGLSLAPFQSPAFAMAVSAAGTIANLAIQAGASVISFKAEVLVFAACNVALFVGPLLFFYSGLKKAKRQGQLKHSLLSGRQIRQFEQKWIASTPGNDDMLTVQDFSAVIDLSSTVANVQNMSTIPFQFGPVRTLLVVSLLPFLPVAALEVPVEVIVKQIMKLVL